MTHQRAAQIYVKIISTYLKKYHGIIIPELPTPNSRLDATLFPDLALPEEIREMCSPPENQQKHLPKVIETLNNQIANLDLSIKNVRDQFSGTPILFLVNLHMSAGTKSATALNAAEIEWLKILLDSMFDDVNAQHSIFAVSPEQIHSAYPTSALNRETVTRAQALQKAEKMVDHGWFAEITIAPEFSIPFEQSLVRAKRKNRKIQKKLNRKSDNSDDDDDIEEDSDDDNEEGDLRETARRSSGNQKYFTLSTRGLAELDRYIREKFGPDSNSGASYNGNVVFCDFCKLIWTVGVKCTGASDGVPCRVHMHAACSERYSRKFATTTCRDCETDLDQFYKIGI